MFLGYLPPVNKMVRIGESLAEQPSFPAELLHCSTCNLVQLGLVVDARILFPSEYPYTSSTTKILRDNFAELYADCTSMVPLSKEDLVVDIGSNDGNLLSNFVNRHRVMGITPEEIGKLAIERGIPTLIDYFTQGSVKKVVSDVGRAKVVTATNVFAHMDDISNVMKSVSELLSDDGVFITESHYLLSLIETLQYDTIYHEHLRYYSLTSLTYLLENFGYKVFHAKRIPTHGGSIRVYAERTGTHDVSESVSALLREEQEKIIGAERLGGFKRRVVESKLELIKMLAQLKGEGARICGISAPSRGSTLIQYTGIDETILDYVVEISGSYKIGNYIPGTVIPIVEEARMFKEQPEYALLLSWHIADELIPKIRSKGFKGKFIVPLPKPTVL